MERFSCDVGPLEGKQVLDFGCGLGGASEFLATKHGANVICIDNQEAMIKECTHRFDSASLSAGSLDFRHGSVAEKALFGPAVADLIWTRDTLLYLPVADKSKVFDNFAHWLKPGGKFMIGDYGICGGPVSAVCADYFSNSDSHPITSEEYLRLLQSDGLLVVDVVEDHTDKFLKFLKLDLDRFESRETEFKALFPGNFYDELRTRWKAKIAASSDGSFQWQRFVGHRRA